MFKKWGSLSTVLLLIIIFCAGAIFAFQFSKELKTTLEGQQYDSLYELSLYNNQTLNAKIEQQDKILEMVATNSVYYKDKTTEELCAFLKTAAMSGSFDRIGVSDTNGDVTFSDDTFGNIAHRWYFKKTLGGNKSIEGPLISVVSGNPIMVFATPIYENGIITGIVHGTYELESAGNTLLKAAEKNDHYTIVTNSLGEILLCNMSNYSYSTSNDLFDVIDRNALSDNLTDEAILLELAYRNSGTFEFTSNGQNNYVFYSPIGIDDWYSFQIVPDSGLVEERNSFNRLSITMLIGYIALLALIFGVLFYGWLTKEKDTKNKIILEKERYLKLLSRIQGGVVILKYTSDSENSMLIYMNEMFEKMLGYNAYNIRNEFGGDIANLIHPDDDPEKIRSYHKTLELNRSYHLQYRLRKRNGDYIWVMDMGYIYPNSQGERTAQILFSDIDILKEHENELQLNAESMKIATNLISGAVFEYDFLQDKFILFENIDKIIGKTNKHIFELYQQRPDKKVSNLLAFLYFVHDKERNDAISAFKRLKKDGSIVFQARLNKNEEYIWCKFHLALVYNSENKPERVIGNIIDVNDTKRQMEQLQNIADHDPLTGILNRQAFVMGVERVLASFPENRHAFFLLDIDNFKGINDNYGHGFGDFVLKNLANSLMEIFDASDLVGRIGGDEFVVFMTNIENIQAIHHKAMQICELYKNPVIDGEHKATVSYSVGIAVYDELHKKSRSTLYLQADSALYKSKEDGKNRYTFYNDPDI